MRFISYSSLLFLYLEVSKNLEDGVIIPHPPIVVIWCTYLLPETPKPKGMGFLGTI